MIKGSDLLLSCLEEEGVEYVFGLPGEENLEFLQSLSESKKIKLILTRHEQAAGFMAATYIIFFRFSKCFFKFIDNFFTICHGFLG